MKNQKTERPQDQPTTKKRGIKKHGGVVSGAVLEDAQGRHDSSENLQDTEKKGPAGERVRDGRKENYNDMTAAELNRQQS